MVFQFNAYAVGAVLLLTSTVSNSALLGRLPSTPGGTDYQAYYDDQLNITWSAQVNVNGQDDWANLNVLMENFSIQGIAGWRLPDFDVNGDGNIVHCISDTVTACLDNELAYMVRVNGYYPMNTGPFSNLDQSGVYVSSTEYVGDTAQVWEISLSVNRTPGSIGTRLKTYPFFHAWAVHDGDVAVVPLPAAFWLFVSGLIGLARLARRK